MKFWTHKLFSIKWIHSKTALTCFIQVIMTFTDPYISSSAFATSDKWSHILKMNMTLRKCLILLPLHPALLMNYCPLNHKMLTTRIYTQTIEIVDHLQNTSNALSDFVMITKKIFFRKDWLPLSLGSTSNIIQTEGIGNEKSVNAEDRKWGNIMGACWLKFFHIINQCRPFFTTCLESTNIECAPVNLPTSALMKCYRVNFYPHAYISLIP